MNKSIPQHRMARALMTACLLGLAGCVSVPMAPLVYGSKTVGGLDISTSTSTANPSVSISLGYKRDDFALVPVAVMERQGQAPAADGKGGERIRIIHGDDQDTNTDCAKPEIARDAAAKARCEAARKAADSKRDSMSVFGSFEGRGLAGGQATSAQAVAANYFSTGIAAQKLAAGVGKAVRTEEVRKCLATVKDLAAGINATERESWIRKGMDACTFGERGTPDDGGQ